MYNSDTGSEVFERAMALADELNTTGQALHSDTMDFARRAPAIISTLLHELRTLEPDWLDTEHERPGAPGVRELDEILALDPELALGVLPYGLGWWLFRGYDPSLGEAFRAEYKSAMRRAARALRLGEREILPFETEYNQFAQW